MSVSRAVGGYRGCPEGPEASWSVSNRPMTPAGILVCANGPGASRRYFHESTKVADLQSSYLTDSGSSVRLGVVEVGGEEGT
jgi:hypothetical protein